MKHHTAFRPGPVDSRHGPLWSGTPANAPERFAVIVPSFPSGDIWDRYAGDDHVGAPRRAYADATIYSWLLRWATSSSRRSP